MTGAAYELQELTAPGSDAALRESEGTMSDGEIWAWLMADHRYCVAPPISPADLDDGSEREDVWSKVQAMVRESMGGGEPETGNRNG